METNEVDKESSESDNEDLLYKCEVRRNRRKNLMPQKAFQSDSHLSNCSELIAINYEDNEKTYSEDMDSSSMSESEFLSNICNDEILKELQENPVNEELLKQLNEEDIFQDSKGTHTNSTKKEEYHTYRSVKCNMCEQVFSHRTDFDKHYTDNYNLKPVYTCTFCNKTTEKYSTFRSHCYRHITEGRFKCSSCSKGFNLKSLLHIHTLAKHSKVKPFACEQCGKKFVTKPGLRIHQKKHKTEIKEDYPCVICGKILHTRGGLTSHMNVHRLGRRFMCDVCGKTFTQKVNMQQHVKQHTGDKPHVCDKCGKTFVEKSHLSRHYSLHSDVRPFKCEICERMYKTERCLKVHSLVHATERPFVCKFCNKGFLSSTKLKQHSNIHTGERPYRCKFCEKTFTNYPNLLKHTRRKHKCDEKQDSTSAPVLTNSDMVEGNNEENVIDQTLISVALTDERYVITQNYDLNGSNSNMGVLVPYLQNSLPSHQSLIQQINQSSISNQFSDMFHSQFLQQSTSDV